MLPPSPPMVRFDIDCERTALLAIDLQNQFVSSSPVAAPEGSHVVARLNTLARECRRVGIPVIWTRHVVRPDRSNAGLLARLVPAVNDGVIDATASSAALHASVEVSEGDIVLDKPRFGCFHGTDLGVILRSRGITTLLLGGINTNVCVDTTAREAAVRDFEVVFLADGTANIDLPGAPGVEACSAEDLQRAVCAVMAFGFAEVVTVDVVISRVKASGRPPSRQAAPGSSPPVAEKGA